MKIGAILLLFIGIAACTPRLYPPQVEVPERYIHADGQLSDTTHIDTAWWRLFGDTMLNRLINRALECNADVATAASRIEQARSRLRITRAQYLPQVGFEIEAEGEYMKPTGTEQTYSVEPTLSWELSLFGALRQAKRSARAQIAAEVWAYRGVRLSLAAEVATVYFTLLEYDRNFSIARHSARLRRKSAALIDSMFRYGFSDGVALEQARSLVYSAEADIAHYRYAVEQTWLTLCTLLDEVPRQANLEGAGLRLLTDYQPTEIPVGLPSELLRRRPDVMQAFYEIRQAAAAVGVARSARFPSISLTAKGGIASSSIKGLTASNPLSWEALGTLAEPIFAFGKLRSAERVAVETYNQAVSSYESTVLAAFSDVENALAAIAANKRQTQRNCELVLSNSRIATMTRSLYRGGMADYLNVLDAERNLYEAQMTLANLVAQQYINYVGLCKALGGGW